MPSGIQELKKIIGKGDVKEAACHLTKLCLDYSIRNSFRTRPIEPKTIEELKKRLKSRDEDAITLAAADLFKAQTDYEHLKHSKSRPLPPFDTEELKRGYQRLEKAGLMKYIGSTGSSEIQSYKNYILTEDGLRMAGKLRKERYMQRELAKKLEAL